MAAAALWAASPSALAQDGCLSYETELTLAGVLSRQTFGGGGGSGGGGETYFFIAPPAPVCMRAGDELEPAEPRVERIQLVFDPGTAAADYARLRPRLGQQVACTGRLFHAITAHHHAPVLLGRAVCKAV
jgi:hypothetical protein